MRREQRRPRAGDTAGAARTIAGTTRPAGLPGCRRSIMIRGPVLDDAARPTRRLPGAARVRISATADGRRPTVRPARDGPGQSRTRVRAIN